jgi:hypothetical protein
MESQNYKTTMRLYDDPYTTYECEITQEKKDLIVERILKYCKDNDCTCGETLHQSDECIIDAPHVLSDIIDNILKFKYTGT